MLRDDICATWPCNSQSSIDEEILSVLVCVHSKCGRIQWVRKRYYGEDVGE